MKQPKKQPNAAGRTGKPIVLPPTTFEDAVKKMLSTPAPSKAPKKPKQQKPTSS
jgi:hypothetical protein